MAVDFDESLVERVAKALYDQAVNAARDEFEKTGVGLEDIDDFFGRLQKESDAALVVLTTSYIDTQLSIAWRKNMPGKSNAVIAALFDNSGPLATMSSKIRLAHGLGWVADAVCNDLHIIRKIRNRFAHDPYKHSLSDNDIVALIDAMSPIDHAIVSVARDGGALIPDPNPRIRFHMRAAALCQRVMIQMVVRPIAIRNKVNPDSVIDSLTDISTHTDLTRRLVILLFELLGMDSSRVKVPKT